MRNLLSANFLRLWRNNTFWGSMGVCLGLGVLMVLDEFKTAQKYEYVPPSLESQLFKYAVFIGILAGELVPLFLGTEYSDGAIRNKITVGCSRTAIYLANLITSFAACALCAAAYMLGCIALGTPLLGWSGKSPALLLTALTGTLLMTAALCAIFTFVAMNISRKSASVVICLLGTFFMLFLSTYLYTRLDAPEYVEYYEISETGQVEDHSGPNPAYLTGTEREAYQFAYDLLPTGQAVQYSALTFTDPVRLMVMSLALLVLFTGAGAALFRRKDLK